MPTIITSVLKYALPRRRIQQWNTFQNNIVCSIFDRKLIAHLPSNFFLSLTFMFINIALLYFGHKYDCFGLANISWTRATILIFVLKMGLPILRANIKNHVILVWYNLYFTICDLEELITSLLLMPHL